MHRPNRRDMMKTSAALGAGFWLGTTTKVKAASANEKLNVACIGVGGRGGANVDGVSGENIVAVCDVDEARAAKNLSRFPGARQYTDFRKMLDEMDRQIRSSWRSIALMAVVIFRLFPCDEQHNSWLSSNALRYRCAH